MVWPVNETAGSTVRDRTNYFKSSFLTHRSHLFRMYTIVGLVLFASTTLATNSIRVNKCCPDGKQFNGQLMCIPYNNSDSEEYYWLPKNFNKTELELSVNFDTTPCDRSQSIHVPANNFKLSRNGSLLLFDGDSQYEATYSVETFCLDKINTEDDEVEFAYLCPCFEHLCISKCCPPRYHVNVEGNSTYCDETKNTLEWNHTVLNGSGIGKYHELVHGTPDCLSKNKQSLYLIGSYELLDDGSIVSKTDGVIRAEDYCGDYVTDESGFDVSKVMACVDFPSASTVSIIYAVLSLIGVIFLLVTALLHLLIPEFGGLPRWSVAIHASCLVVAYLCNAFQQLIPTAFTDNVCIGIGMLKFV